MQMKNTEYSWGAVQKAMHWFVALVVISQLTIGFIFTSLPEKDPLVGKLFNIHTTIGVIILLSMLARFLWRQANPVPALPDTLSSGQKKLAVANHWAFYAVLIGMPLGGYLMVNASGYPVHCFGIALPDPDPEERGIGRDLRGPPHWRSLRPHCARGPARGGCSAPRVPAQGQHLAAHDVAAVAGRNRHVAKLGRWQARGGRAAQTLNSSADVLAKHPAGGMSRRRAKSDRATWIGERVQW